MRFIDMRVVLMDQFITNVVCAAVMALLWRQNRRRYPEISFWLADYLLQVVGLLLVGLRGVLPDFLCMVGGNALVLSGVLLLYMGLERFVGRVGSQTHNYALLGLFLFLQTFFLYAHPSLDARTLNVMGCLLVLFVQCIRLLRSRADERMREISGGVALVFAGYALVTAARIVLTVLEPTGRDFFESTRAQTMLMMGYQMLLIFLTYALFLMVNRRLLLEFQALAESSQAANRAKTVFLANISHEIRTPMTAITGFLDLLKESSLSPEQREHVDTARQSSQMLQVLLKDMLDLAKIEAGRLPLTMRPFDPRRTVEEVAWLLRPAAENKRLSLDCVFGPGLPPRLRGDPIRLKQVLTNLAGNAVKFTDSGKIVIVAELEAKEESLRADGGPGDEDVVRLVFRVDDTGIGIGEAELERIFKPFEQVEGPAEGAQGGVGLGLSISRELVRMMGGALHVNSRKGAGTSFRFSLPFGRVSEADAAAARESAPRQAARSLRVLLVEDTETNRRLAQHLLERRGHRVATATTGAAGLELLRKEDFDVVLLDLRMPGLDGFGVTAALRGEGSRPGVRNVPVVAFTAHAMPGERERCLAAGMDGYLLKPFTEEELLEAVESHSSGRRAPAAGASSPEEAGPPLLPEDAPGPSGARAELLKRHPGEDWLADELLRVFREEAPELKSAVLAAARQGDLALLEIRAHAFKSAAGTAGYLALEDSCRRLEESARAGDWTSIETLLADLTDEAERV